MKHIDTYHHENVCIHPCRHAERTVSLDQNEWNHLTVMDKSGTMILHEVIAPFKTNPNVDIQLQFKSCGIKISGVPDAVDSAYDHITGQLNKDIHVKSR